MSPETFLQVHGVYSTNQNRSWRLRYRVYYALSKGVQVALTINLKIRMSLTNSDHNYIAFRLSEILSIAMVGFGLVVLMLKEAEWMCT